MTVPRRTLVLGAGGPLGLFCPAPLAALSHHPDGVVGTAAAQQAARWCQRGPSLVSVRPRQPCWFE